MKIENNFILILLVFQTLHAIYNLHTCFLQDFEICNGRKAASQLLLKHFTFKSHDIQSVNAFCFRLDNAFKFDTFWQIT